MKKSTCVFLVLACLVLLITEGMAGFYLILFIALVAAFIRGNNS